MFYTLTEEEYTKLKSTPTYQPSDIMIISKSVISIDGKLETGITLQLNNGRPAVLNLSKAVLQELMNILSKD